MKLGELARLLHHLDHMKKIHAEAEDLMSTAKPGGSNWCTASKVLEDAKAKIKALEEMEI